MTACLKAEHRISSPPEYQAVFLLPRKQHSCGRKYNTHEHAYVYHEEDSDYLFEFKGP
jgi:hypothetical protein